MVKLNLFQNVDRFNDNLCLCRQFITALISYQLLCVCGFSTGFTSNVLSQLEVDKSLNYDTEIGSWIASISALFMSLGCLIVGGITDKFGRKAAHFAIALPTILGWLLLGFAKSTVMILIARAIIGISAGAAARPACFVYISEITDPKYRGIMLCLGSLALNVGILLIHTITYYVNWKISSFFCAAWSLLDLVLICFMKESPVWLMKQGKDQEAVKIFQEFRGVTEGSAKELGIMIEKAKINAVKQTMHEKVKIMFSLRFLKPFMVGCLITLIIQFCGISTFVFYSKDVFESTFGGSVDSFLMTIVTDLIKIVVTIISCVLVKFVRRKLLFLVACYGTVFILICIILFLYLDPDNLVWLLVLFIVIYIFFMTFIIAIGWSLISEIMPTAIRGTGTGLTAAVSFLSLFVCVKVSPGITAKFGQIGQFTMYATLTLVCCVLLSFIMPKTDGKTLQEIEDKYDEDRKR